MRHSRLEACYLLLQFSLLRRWRSTTAFRPDTHQRLLVGRSTVGLTHVRGVLSVPNNVGVIIGRLRDGRNGLRVRRLTVSERLSDIVQCSLPQLNLHRVGKDCGTLLSHAVELQLQPLRFLTV